MTKEEIKNILGLEENTIDMIPKSEILRKLRIINYQSFQDIISEMTLESIAKHFVIRCKSRNIIKENQELELKKYLRICIVHFFKTYEALENALMNPYKGIYRKQNTAFGLTASEELENIFQNCCVQELIEYQKKQNIHLRITNAYKKELKKKRENVLTIKTSVPKPAKQLERKVASVPVPKPSSLKPTEPSKQKELSIPVSKPSSSKSVLQPQKNVSKSIEPPKKEKLLLATYCGQEEQVIFEIVSALPREEQKIKFCKTEEELLKNVITLNKINWGLRYYPLLKYFEPSFVERNRALKLFYERNQYSYDIKQNELKFYKYLNPNFEIVIQEIKKLEQEDNKLYHKLCMFLGRENIIRPVRILEDVVTGWILEWSRKDLSGYSLFSKLKEIPYEKVYEIIDSFQTSYPGYYKIIGKKYGLQLREYHILNEQEELKVEEAIEKIKYFYKFMQNNPKYLEEIHDKRLQKEKDIAFKEWLLHLPDSDKEFVRKRMQFRINKRKLRKK